MAVVIRAAVAEDAALVVALVRELAAYEHLAEACVIGEEDVRTHGFGPNPRFGCLLAESDGAAVGLALYYPTFSTFAGRPGLFLEDLYVRESARGRGVGRALVAALAQHALGLGMNYIDLRVLDWNPARGFYERLGFSELTAWDAMRLGARGMAALAAPR